MSEDIFDV